MAFVPPRPLAALSLLIALGAVAAAPEHDPARSAPGWRPRHPQGMPQHPVPPTHKPGQHMPQHHPMASDTPPMSHFHMTQRYAAERYFAQPGHQGFVPPGLARKGGVPPGQTKVWKRGQVLPAGVVWYALPRSLELELGPPPAGHRYVRVAADILLITTGTGLVVDALEDIAR